MSMTLPPKSPSAPLARRARARRTACAAGALLLGLLGACGGGTPARLNTILVSFDTTRADAPSCYGVTTDVSPTIDRMASEGVKYERAYTVAPLTLPSHTTMLTGLYPPRHSVRVNGRRPLPQAATTLAETASKAGFQTGAFVGAVVLAPTFGLDQGFDVYDAPAKVSKGVTSFYDERPADEVFDAALAWLRARDRERPFFLWVHAFDPHMPYDPPADYTARAPGANAYLGEVLFTDTQLGRLLGFLEEEDVLDETFLAVVSDHGEGLGDHGERTHAGYCWESTMRIPFVLRYPDGFRAGESTDEIVSLIDIAPTLAEAMALPPLPDIDGKSLYRKEVPADRGIYFESFALFAAYGWSPFSGWLDRDMKYIHSTSPHLYAVGTDPRETRNLYGQPGTDVEPFKKHIADVASRHSLALEGVSAIDEEMRDHVRALGYADSGEELLEMPHPLAIEGLVSPMDRRGLAEMIDDATALSNGQLYDQAQIVLEKILAEDPDNVFALSLLGTCLIRQSLFADAIAPLRELLRRGRRGVSTYFNLGVSLREVGRDDEAIEAFEHALELAPGEHRILQHLAELHRAAGRDERAAEYEAQR